MGGRGKWEGMGEVGRGLGSGEGGVRADDSVVSVGPHTVGISSRGFGPSLALRDVSHSPTQSPHVGLSP